MMDEKYCCFIIFLYLLFGISAESVENCTVKEHLPCTLYWGVSDCDPSGLQSKFSFLRSNDSWPGKVSSFDVNMTLEYWSEYKRYYPKGVFTFIPPQDSSIKFVKGFVVMQYRSDTEVVKCYVFDLSNATWKAGVEDFTTVFTLTLNIMKDNVVYYLDVYTLPLLPTLFDKKESLRLSVNTSPSYAGLDPFFWKASISYKVINESREVRVSFSAPPVEFNFVVYEITLKNVNGGVRQAVNISKTDHTFKNVKNGVYQIRVMPKQEPCGCRRNEFLCEFCLTTHTQNFTIDIELPTTTSIPTISELPRTTSIPESSTESSVLTSKTSSVSTPIIEAGEESKLKVILAVVGSLMGALLVGVLVGCYCYYFYRRKQKGNENDNYKNPVKDDDLDSMVTVDQLKAGTFININNAEKMKPQHRPKLFILYEEDHPYHRKVVDKFACYLQQHCHCDVMQAQLNLDTTWVHQEIQNADYVIIVNSHLAYAIYQSMIRRNQSEPERTQSGNIKLPGINCILQRFLQEPRYDKVIMVYFNYTSEDHVITDICPGYHYMLMKHISDLLLHIHKLRTTDNLAQYDIPLDGKYYLKPVGKDLETAIREAAAYERENPDWFAKKYGYLRSFSNGSDESKFDSGIPPEPIFLDPISSHLQNLLDSTSQDAITVTPPTISIEAGRTYMTLSPRNFQEHVYDNYNKTKPVNETPTTADSGAQFDFFPPDDMSEFETASKTQSEQMLSINARNFGHDNKAYDWQQDLTLLRVQSGEIRFEDTRSLGGESV